MSDQNETQQLTLDDMNYFWMSNGAPCFIANQYSKVDDICQLIESFGFQIYYLITDKMIKKTANIKNDKGVPVPTDYYEYVPAVLKVVNNFTARAIMDAQDPLGNDFCPVEEEATYNMPPIPRVIVDKLDEFFRLVEAQHGTESIVILTYDTTKQGSEGWGVLVPEQSNTSVHCKYEADSVAELKPDHVMIVGSVHSHPGMAAYASGTDHDDQADFDGLHITYGWQKSINNGATQYHIELQIGGSTYTLKPEDVFEKSSLKDADPEVIEWATKVKKVTPPYQGGFYNSTTPDPLTPTTVSYPHTQGGTVTPLYDYTVPDHFVEARSRFLSDLTAIEKDAIVGFEYDSLSPLEDCLVCTIPLDPKDIDSGFCASCDTPIILSTMTHDQIIDTFYTYAISRDQDPANAYYLYCVDTYAHGSGFLINLKPDGQSPISAVSDSDLIESKVKALHCCGVPETRSCNCPTRISDKEIIEFDSAHNNVDIYDPASKCFECDHYYDTSCPFYKQSVVDYLVNDIRTNQHAIKRCSYFTQFQRDTDIYSYAYEREKYD